MNTHRDDRKPVKYTFAYHQSADNVGDIECSPIRHISFPNAKSSRLIKHLPPADTLVLGGGAIFGALESYVEQNAFDKYRRVVAWGIGGPTEEGDQSIGRINKVAQACTLLSTRDYNWKNVVDFVPCPSCLSPDFDDLPPPTRKVVIYLHRKKTQKWHFRECPHPIYDNSAKPLREVLEFLASAETIVTNSYHGVYWSQLIGRRILCLPYGAKFYTFQDPPAMSAVRDWEQTVPIATKFPSRLSEYRDINLSFMRKAFDL